MIFLRSVWTIAANLKFPRFLARTSVGVIFLSAFFALLLSSPVFAESAPVYDADSVQFDNSMDQQDQRDVPPPPPEQEGFKPIQVANNGQAANNQEMPTSMRMEHLSVEQRMQRVEQQINTIQNGDISARVGSLQDQVQSLQGQVELLTHQLQQLQAQSKAQYQDMDKRLTQQNALTKTTTLAAGDSDKRKKPVTKLAVTSSATESISTRTDVNQPNVAEEQEIYQTAYNMIKAKKYDEAVKALQGMLHKYPSGQFASNAHYWLGELYGLMGKNDQALNEFNTVVKLFPDSPRVSDAQLKVGLILASQSKWSEAKTIFKKIINRYPGTASARLASENLKQIQHQVVR